MVMTSPTPQPLGLNILVSGQGSNVIKKNKGAPTEIAILKLRPHQTPLHL